MNSSQPKKVNLLEGLQVIEITPSHLSSLAGLKKGIEMLEKYGVNPNNYYPRLVKFITYSEWTALVNFYSKRVGYEPARRELRKLKE